MRKVVIACNGKSFPKGAFEMVKRLNEEETVLLAGVFLHAIDIAMMPVAVGAEGMLSLPSLVEDDRAIIEETIRYFEQECQHHQIEYRVHKDLALHSISELVTETRFADMLLLSDELFFSNQSLGQPNEMMQELLHKTECPVLLVPEKFEEPESVVLAYDGSESSMFAIKQFSYLFPSFSKLEAVLVYASDDKVEIPDVHLVREYLARHYPNLTLTKLDFNPKKYFTSWLENTRNPLLVSGAYGRSMLSLFMKKSFIAEAIQEHKVPLFVAHK
jgi:hypothetical protein